MNIEADKKKFVKKVIACDLGLLMFATLIFASTGFSFGITLFGLGILVCSLSTWAGATKQILHGLVSPLYEFTTEGAFFWAGFIAILVSSPFLCQIMYW